MLLTSRALKLKLLLDDLLPSIVLTL